MCALDLSLRVCHVCLMCMLSSWETIYSYAWPLRSAAPSVVDVAAGTTISTPVPSLCTAQMSTLCGVGYGDIYPRNDVERGFMVFVMVLGSLAHAIVFANIAAQIEGSTRVRSVCG